MNHDKFQDIALELEMYAKLQNDSMGEANNLLVWWPEVELVGLDY